MIDVSGSNSQPAKVLSWYPCLAVRRKGRLIQEHVLVEEGLLFKHLLIWWWNILLWVIHAWYSCCMSWEWVKAMNEFISFPTVHGMVICNEIWALCRESITVLRKFEDVRHLKTSDSRHSLRNLVYSLSMLTKRPIWQKIKVLVEASWTAARLIFHCLVMIILALTSISGPWCWAIFLMCPDLH